jgi:hypothetical protein
VGCEQAARLTRRTKMWGRRTRKLAILLKLRFFEKWCSNKSPADLLVPGEKETGGRRDL